MKIANEGGVMVHLDGASRDDTVESKILGPDGKPFVRHEPLRADRDTRTFYFSIAQRFLLNKHANPRRLGVITGIEPKG